MRGRGFRQDQRSVSEIYGTVLIISLAFLTALLLVGAGWLIVDQITTQSQDSLAQDSMRSMDQGIEQIAGSSVNETTTFEFPEGTGSDVSVEAEDGVLTLNITTDEDDFWHRTTAEARGWDRTNGTWGSHNGPDPVVLGTILHEAESGGTLAYQGGGLWRKPNPNGTVFIESEPSIDFTGNSLDLGVVNLTSLDAITEGAEVQATENAEAETNRELQAFMAHYWTDRYNPSVGAPVQINLTVESQFADGWETYARERMSVDPDSSANFNVERDGDTVYLNFTIDNEMPDPGDVDFGGGVLYSGSSDLAYKYHDGDDVHGAFEENPGTGPIKPTLNTSEFNTSLDVHKQYEFALYNESGRWLIFNSSFGSDGRWEDYEGEPVDVNHTEALNHSRGPSIGTPVNHTSHEFFVDPPAWLNKSGGAPVCVVTHDSGDVDITQNLTEGGECLENMVGLNEDLVDPIPVSPEFNVSIDPSQPATYPEYKSGEEFPLEVEIANEGEIGGEIPLGVYLLNETNFDNENFTEAILANGTQAEDNYLAAADQPGNSTTYDYTIELKDEWRMADDKHDEWMLFATTGTDTETLNTTSDDIDWFEVEERNSKFLIEDNTSSWFEVPAFGGNLKQGEYVQVNITVNETKNELNTDETQVVRLERNGRLINQTEVTLGPTAGSGNSEQWKDNVTMGWQISPDAPDEVTLNATTYDMDSPQPKTVTIAQTDTNVSEFEVDITDVEEDVVAGEKLDVNATVENVGNATGDVFVELANFDDNLVDVTEVTGLASGDTADVTLTWATEVGDNGTGTLTVEAGQDDDTGSATIDAPGETDSQFDVTINGTNSPVTAGQTLYVNATVKNTGDEEDTQFIVLENFDGDQTDFAEKTLAGGESASLNLTWDTAPVDNGTDDITVRSNDDDDTSEVTVNPPGPSDSQFDVAFQGDDYGVSAGDPLSVQVDVTNSGSEEDTQFIYLEDYDGNIVDTVEVGPLGAGDSQTETVTLDTSLDDAGNYTNGLTVVSNDDTDTADVDVFPPDTDESNFEVTIESTNSPVTESEDLEVTATIENTGDSSDTQFVVLENFDGGPVDVQEIELNSGETHTTTFTWETIVGDAGSGDVSVVSADDSDSAPATIEEKENELRDPVDVVFTIDETGSMDWNDPSDQRIEATRTGIDALNETLGDNAAWVQYSSWFWGNARTKQSLTNDHEGLKSSLSTYDRGGTDVVSAIEEGENALESGSNDPYMILLTDGIHNYNCDNQNDPYGECANDIRDAADNVDEDVTIYTVAFGSYLKEPLNYTATQGGSGEGEFLEADDADQLEDIFESIVDEVTEPETPTFGVDIVDTNDPVNSSETLEVEVNVTNTGAVAGEGIVSLADFDDTNVDSETTSNLSVGESETLTLEWDTTGEPAATDDVTAVTVDDSDTETVEINPPTTTPSDFKVQSVDVTNSPVTEGETLTVEAEIENLGAADTQDIVLWDFGKNEVVDTEELTLEGVSGDNDDPVTLEWDTEIGDANDSQITVATPDDEQSKDATVLPSNGTSPEFTVDIDEGASTLDVNEGETVVFKVDVTNEGNETASQQIYLQDHDGPGLLDANETGDIGPGDSNSTTVTLTWDTSTGDGGLDENLTVASNDDQDSARVTVSEPDAVDSDFTVDIDESASDDETNAGDELTIEAEITNDGDDQDEQNVLLRDFSNSVVDIQSVNLTAGESQNITLTWDTDEDDVGGPDDVTVESDDDDDTTEVEVTDNGTAAYEVLIDDGANDDNTVEVGDTFSATVEVETNVSVAGSNELVWLEIEDQGGNTTAQAYTEVDIPADGTKEVTLEWEPDETDVGEYTFDVRTNDDVDPDNDLTVEPQTTPLEIQSVEPVTEPIAAGEEVEVQVEVTNTESDPVSDAIVELEHQEIGYIVNIDFDVDIGPGATETVTFNYDTFIGTGDDENAQNLEARIANTEESKTGELQVDEADSNVDDPSMEEPTNPLDIDLDQIEIGT